MGNTMPKRLDMKTLGHLKRSTHLNSHQVRRLHKRFRELSGGGWLITKEQFYKGLKDSGVYTNDTNDDGALHAADWRFVESFFDALDTDQQGTINFREFCTGIAVFASGNLHDSLKTVFEMYNLAGDDRITEDEIYEAIHSMSSVLNLDHFSPGNAEAEWLKGGDKLREWVHQVVTEADVSKTGSLTYQEFYSAVCKHPLLQQMAEEFVTEICKDFFHADK
ncbi:Neuronal calcium sensor 2 [Diplonema papillatum]|nr:Neuronal calcium sensor 2 [Diplonema papillatum]